MPGFLDRYGEGDARREKIIKRIVWSAVLVAIAGAVLWYFFRNFREERQISRFLELLKKKDYQAAYALWGCTEATPCPSYKFEKFLEDWGPQSPHSNLAILKVGGVKSCDAGIIQFLNFGPDEEVMLWVGRKDKVIGFAPWPVCNPRIPAP